MTVIPFPPRVLRAATPLERFAHARRAMLTAFADLARRGEHDDADLLDEIEGTGNALLNLLHLLGAKHG